MSRQRPDDDPTDDRVTREEEDSASSPLDMIAGIVRDEQLLWPVAAVSWLIACTFGGFVLFYALFERSLAGGVALLFGIFFTVWGLDRDIRDRRLGAKNALVLSLWTGSVLAAFGLRFLGA